ncbi:MAG: 5'/3'-nucleotidase SurE [Deltaproteobacteria bacterium]|nr:5'/3'-nucleotidase SurE [Deltaproteobacteria bacterium]
MKVILTNDDGIDAPGLETLQRCVQDEGKIVIVAPTQPQSGIAHKVTIRSPIQVNKLGLNRYSVDGTPADCSRIALKQLAPDAGWLIAGINPGANLGSDVYNSGTVAAAREAAILGCRSIAISQYVAKDQQVNWDITGYHAAPVLKMLMRKDIEPSYFWNVNLPHPLNNYAEIPVGFCGLDTNPHKYDFRKNEKEYIYNGSIHERPRNPGTDVAVCFDERKISITRIAVGTT